MTKLSKPLIAASAFVIATAAFAQPPRESKSGLADVHGDTDKMSAMASAEKHREAMTKSAKGYPKTRCSLWTTARFATVLASGPASSA
jgi:hypothetical protein